MSPAKQLSKSKNLKQIHKKILKMLKDKIHRGHLSVNNRICLDNTQGVAYIHHWTPTKRLPKKRTLSSLIQRAWALRCLESKTKTSRANLETRDDATLRGHLERRLTILWSARRLSRQATSTRIWWMWRRRWKTCSGKAERSPSLLLQNSSFTPVKSACQFLAWACPQFVRFLHCLLIKQILSKKNRNKKSVQIKTSPMIVNVPSKGDPRDKLLKSMLEKVKSITLPHLRSLSLLEWAILRNHLLSIKQRSLQG